MLLSEQRKSDGKIFHDLRVGNKAKDLISKLIDVIDYTYEDIKPKDEVPFGWKYGKAIKQKKAYKILRNDFKGNIEVIGYIPLDSVDHKIITVKEYEEKYEHAHL